MPYKKATLVNGLSQFNSWSIKTKTRCEKITQRYIYIKIFWLTIFMYNVKHQTTYPNHTTNATQQFECTIQITLLYACTGCPRMFYTVFQKNIKNIKSTMSPIIILVIECLICALPTVKISFFHCDVTWYLWKLTNNQNAISAQKVNSLKHYTNKQGRWIHHFLERKAH